MERGPGVGGEMCVREERGEGGRDVRFGGDGELTTSTTLLRL